MHIFICNRQGCRLEAEELRTVLSFLNPYRKPIAIALLLMLAELLVELWHPLLMAKIIDNGIQRENLPIVLQWGGVMMAISLLGFVSGIVNSYFAAHVSQSFGFELRKRLFEKMQSFSFAAFNRFPTSTLITRITSDVTQLQNVVFMSLRIMLRAPLFMIGGLLMALFVNAKLALVLVVLTPLLLLFVVWIMKKSFLFFHSLQDRLDRTNGVLRESLLGMRLIRVFVREHHETERFTEANDDLMKRTMSALRLVELTLPVLMLVLNLGVLFILWYGSVEVNAGGADIGEVVAVVNYALRIVGSFSVFSWILMSLARARASFSRIAEVLETADDGRDTNREPARSGVTKGKVVFEQVSFRYPDTAEPVLNAVSFTADPGETVAILGATGSGKTSLFQLIPRLYEASGGRILIDETDIRTMNADALRTRIGFVPQEALLFTGTVKENIRWGKEDAAMEDVIEAARHAQIHDTIMKLPLQYETVVGQKGVNLSGGQKQRLSIARALIRRPALLLLDDSTSALDVTTEANLLAALKQYDCTTLIITQKISTAMGADTVILLDDGSVLDHGKHRELLHRSPLYRKIVESQFGEEGWRDARIAK